MQTIRLAIPDVVVLEPRVFGDARGFFLEDWNAETYRKLQLPTAFVQDNHSRSNPGVLRGLHYQLKRPQGNLVRVLRGAIFDVAVDMRRSSPTFGRWVGAELSEDNKKLVWIPPGFAHGFCVTRGPADVLYKCTDYYAPGDECCVRWDDPDLAIGWPHLDGPPLVSDRDAAGKAWRDAETYA